MSFENYIGKSESVEELISATQTQKICATLGHRELKDGDYLPHLWQWCFFVRALHKENLGRDGHPRLGGSEDSFLPDFGEVNRMWAGGRFIFLESLIIGKECKKVTTIKAIKEKSGRSGKLIFVTLLHEYFQDSVKKISEEQDIVYTEPTPPKLSSDLAAPSADFSKTYEPNETTLFRYSALTFNGHRIHYDFPYATKTERYSGLVIHGPLLATYMIHTFLQKYADKKALQYSYRGLHALCVPQRFSAEGRILESTSDLELRFINELSKDSKVAQVWINKDGGIAHQGQIEFC